MLETKETHPAYGMVAFNRIAGGSGKFFGSPLSNHGMFIQLVVKRAARYHELSKDRYYGEQEVLMVEMTASQFTNLITSMNIGDGVPCTIKRILGESQGNLPESELLEVERIQDNYEQELEDMIEDLPAIEREVEEILNRPNLRKEDKVRLRAIFGMYRRHITDHAPFVLKQFRESAERVVDAAKREVVEFVNTVIAHTGIEALKAQKESIALKSKGE